MDNADLESLTVKPGRLNPKFGMNVTEYTILLPSAATVVRVDALTSDGGSSWELDGLGGERQVTLKDGLNPVVVKVSAPDGSVKKYTINVTKLAANLAELSNLTVTPGKLDRPYQKKTSDYFATLGWSVCEVKVKPVKQDPKSTINIDGNPPDQAIALTSMETTVNINVTSPDTTVTKRYTVQLLKEDTGYRTVPEGLVKEELICVICSSLCQSAKALTQCGHVFCTVCLSVTQRTDKSCPCCKKAVPAEPPFEAPHPATTDQISALSVLCFYCKTVQKNSELLSHAIECDQRLVRCESCLLDVPQSELESHGDACVEKCPTCSQKFSKTLAQYHKSMCLESGIGIELKHSIKVSPWEKKLRVDTSESVDELLAAGEKQEAAYHKAKHTAELKALKELLNSAATAYANAVSVSAKSAKAHYKLGVVMEELFFLEDLMGKEVVAAAESANQEAQDSSKSEEIDAICELHGVSKGQPLGDKLRAIDAEYHSLRDKGDSFRADRVQGLYAWKSKQATQAEKVMANAASEETYLGRAGAKYTDAVSLEPGSFLYNYALGRCLINQQKWGEAVARLRVAAGAKANNSDVQYLLGIALGGSGSGDKDETLLYLEQGVRMYQHWISCVKRDGAVQSNEMLAVQPKRYNNPQLLQGFIELSKLSQGQKKIDLLLTLVYLAPRLLQTILRRGDIYLQIESILFQALTDLIEVVPKEQVPTFCNRLSMLITKSPDSGNKKLLELQVETSRKLVFGKACDGKALTTLGDALLSLYDITQGGELLAEATVCYRTAISVEGQAIASAAVPKAIQELEWYKERTEPAPPPAAKGARGAPAARGRGAARGAPAGRGKAAPPARGGPAKRGAARGAPAGRGAARGGAKAKCDHAAEPPAEPVAEAPEAPVVGPVNMTTSAPRLGLARVLGLSKGDKEEQKALYKEVIGLDNASHDAYIELAQLCGATMEAVDVYDKFPFSSEPTFDDAYIYGEMVQILMKKEEYDDARLEKSLIGFGLVMGWNSLGTFVTKLEDKYKTGIIKTVYCVVNKKDKEDADVQQFFRAKVW